MDYKSAWNKIVLQVKKNFDSKEEIIQSSWELLFSTIFDYSDSEIDVQRSVQMGVATKRADIVIKNGDEDLFVLELKRHFLHEGQEQLFSYLNQMKMDLGVLVSDRLYIFDYNFAAKEEQYISIEISFEQDSPLGIKFVELFTKENFNKEAVKEFIKSSNEKNNIENEIRNQLTSDFVRKLLQNHFEEKYSSGDIGAILSKYNITVSEKRNEINQINNNTDSFTKFSVAYSGSKDNTQYMVNGIPSGGKGPTVYTAIRTYVKHHPNISFEELQRAFPDSLAKPGFGKLIRRVEEVTQKEWKGSRFKKQPIILFDGTQVAVSTQWKPSNMNTFISGAMINDIEIKPI